MAEYATPAPSLKINKHRDALSQQRISPLELLHPNGFAIHAIIIGHNCPAMLLPEPGGRADGQADLVLLAPSTAEWHSHDWLLRAAQLAVEKLTTDGIVYVLAPPKRRTVIANLLTAHGLSINPLIVHLPGWASRRHLVLVPLEPVTVSYALSNLILVNRWRRYLALVALRLPGGIQLLGRLLPSVGLAARHPDARPLFDWLFQLDGGDNQTGSAILSTRWYGPGGTAVLHRFSGSEKVPSAVAKIPLTETMVKSRIQEASILDGLASVAGRTGIKVPQAALVTRGSGPPVLLQSVLGGQSAATLLASRPWYLPVLVEHISRWLERWHRATKVTGTFSAERLDRELLAPARLLVPFLEQGQAYLAWLTARCMWATGIEAPFVATHNDLTMWNILMDEQGQLGVVDWEQAREVGLPLVDFFYAIADAAAACQCYSDRLEAFASCFAPDGALAFLITQFEQRLRQALTISAAVADLCFHSCWLQHAANERAKKQPGEPRPFLDIVQWLVHKQMSEGGSNCDRY